MKKLVVLIVLVGAGALLAQSWPDIQRYVRMRAM